MDKRLMLALGVTSIWGSAESVYALAQQDRLVEDRQYVRVKPSLSAKKAKRDSNGRLKLSINLKGGKSPSSLQALKNKKLSKKQARAARKKFSLALKPSKKKELSSLIQAKKKARLVAKRNRKIALRVKQLERKRLQFRKNWERQEARLQAKKSRLLKKNPVALKRQKLQEQRVLNRLRAPTVSAKKVESVRNIRPQVPASSLLLRAPNVENKTISPVQKAAAPISRLQANSSLLKIVAVKKTEGMQARFKAANDSSEQSVLREHPLEGSISLERNEQPNPLPLLSSGEQRDVEMHVDAPNQLVLENLEGELNSENPIPVLRILPLEGSISLERNEPPSPLALLSSGEQRDVEMHVGDVSNDTEIDENINHVPNQLVSKVLTLGDLELNSENLAPVLQELTGKIWELVEDVSATSQDSLAVLTQLTTFAGVVNELAQQLNPYIDRGNDLAREGGYDWESLHDDPTINFYSQTPDGYTLTREGEDLKKDWVPLPAEESDFDMVMHATQMETLEKTISEFYDAAQQLREKVERSDSDDIEGNKTELRKQLGAAFKIESTLSSLESSLQLPESDAEPINSLLKGHEESVGTEKLRLSMALKNLLELEAKSNVTSSLSQPTQVDVQEDTTVHSATLSTTSLPVVSEENELQTGISTLDQKDVEPENNSSLASKLVATDSEELSTRPFPSLLGSLNELLDGLVDRASLNADVGSGYSTMKLYSSWLKEKLVAIETGAENTISSSIVSKQEESYDFAADMKDLRSKVSHYLTLPTPSNANDWLVNFKISRGKDDAMHLIKDLTQLNQEFEEKDQKRKDSIPAVQPSAPSQEQPSATTVQSSAPSQQQPPVAVAAQPAGWWGYLTSPFSARPAVTPSPQDPSNGNSGTPPQDPSNGSGSNSSNNNDKD